MSRNDFIAVFYEWGGICMNFPSIKSSFYSFDQFWPYWPSKTCFFRTVLTGVLTVFSKAGQNLPTLDWGNTASCQLSSTFASCHRNCVKNTIPMTCLRPVTLIIQDNQSSPCCWKISIHSCNFSMATQTWMIRSYFRKNQWYFKFVFIKYISLGDTWWVQRTVSIVNADVLVLYHPCLTKTETKWLFDEFPF